MVIVDLRDITMIEACKFYIRESTSDCKGTCCTKHCSWEKAEVFCPIVCHFKFGSCENMDE